MWPDRCGEWVSYSPGFLSVDINTGVVIGTCDGYRVIYAVLGGHEGYTYTHVAQYWY